MKMERFHVGQLVWSSLDNAEVTIGQLGFDQSCVAANGHTWSWRRHVTLTPLEPKVGDRVRCVAIAPINSNPAEFSVGEEFTVGQFHTAEEMRVGRDRLGAANCYFRSGEGRFGGWIEAVLLSRASPPAEVKERKCYGSRPSELPKTLPAGTKWKKAKEGYGREGVFTHAARREGVFTHAAQLGVGFYVGHGHEFEGGDPVERHVAAERIDWSTVEIQPAPTSAGEAVAAGWVPREGELCEGLGSGSGLKRTGRFIDYDDWDGKPSARLLADDGVDVRWVLRDSLKPISPPPAGSADAATREDAEAKPSSDAPRNSAQPVGGGSLKPDPYRKATIAQCMHRNADLRSGHCPDCGASSMAAREVDRQLNFLRWSDEQDKLAASRKLAQTKEAMDRPAVERHPREWPEGAGDEQELYVS